MHYHRTEEFARNGVPSNELQIYTWYVHMKYCVCAEKECGALCSSSVPSHTVLLPHSPPSPPPFMYSHVCELHFPLYCCVLLIGVCPD